MRRIQIEKEVKKDIKKLKRDIKERFFKIIKKIVETPSIGKPLRYDLRGSRSIRLGPYRILYKLTADSIIIQAFEHRKKIYSQA